MSGEDPGPARRHLQVCARFGAAVAAANGRWDRPSPCSEWNARGVLEHVIGFHDVLLLRPLGAKPSRPRDRPEQRWALTVDALAGLFARPGLFDAAVDVPAVGSNAPMQVDARRLVPMLTQDVLVHTWDLARAVGADDSLDPEMCRMFWERLPPSADAQVASGMFAPPVEIADSATAPARLLARLGRDPDWQ